jgi:hypothetical protein
METVTVPETAFHGGSTTLRCDFLLEADQLLSLKWYKDEVNFFSYRPQASPPIHGFTVQVRILFSAISNGKIKSRLIALSWLKSDFCFQKNASLNEITLRNLTLAAAGAFRCEVSAERPSYRTLYGGGNLSIIGKPNFSAKRDPVSRILKPFGQKLGQVRGKP